MKLTLLICTFLLVIGICIKLGFMDKHKGEYQLDITELNGNTVIIIYDNEGTIGVYNDTSNVIFHDLINDNQ